LPIPDAEVWVVPLSRDEFLSVVLERDVAADPMDGDSIVTHTEEAVEEEEAWSPPSGGRNYGEELERLGEEARAWAASGRSPEREHRLVTHLRALAGDRYPNVTVLLDEDPKALRDRVTGLLRDSARP
jgi:hypothetical protein